ncbi:hypothetical protein [Streptomyces sp. NPDC006195]|uniref:hypothetical protein n=1 Tax=unclassified Streptomyces TaxID=2593676 RepID=UPI0033ADB06E
MTESTLPLPGAGNGATPPPVPMKPPPAVKPKVPEATFANAVRGALPRYAGVPIFQAARQGDLRQNLPQAQVRQVIRYSLEETTRGPAEAVREFTLDRVAETPDTVRDDLQLLARHGVASWEALAQADIGVREEVMDEVFRRDTTEADTRFAVNAKAAKARLEARNTELGLRDEAGVERAAREYSAAVRGTTPPRATPATDLSRQDTRPPWDILASNGFHPRRPNPVETVRDLLGALHAFSNIPEATREYKKTNGNLGALIGAVACSRGAQYLGAGQASSGLSATGFDYVYAFKSVAELGMREVSEDELHNLWGRPGKRVPDLNREVRLFVKGHTLETAERIAVFHGATTGGDELTFLTPLRTEDILAWKITTTRDRLSSLEKDVWYDFNADAVQRRAELDKQRDTFFTLTG